MIGVRDERPHEFTEHLRGGSILASTSSEELLAKFTLNADSKAGILP
ncbi:hypothetical protein [Aquisediminimonas profunda]|nr:hypothetical protein [Aquisediminimonas profunda]